MADDFMMSLDMSNFKTTARHLRKVAPELLRELNREIKKAGDAIAVEAKARASWSDNIPGQIKVQRRGTSVKIVVGVGSAPHLGEGPAFEHNGLPGTFRHPVGGDRGNWVDQEARPFLGPAFLAGQEAAIARIVTAIDRLIDQL